MAPKLLMNATVVTFDEETASLKVLPRASILIIEDRIAAIDEDLDRISVPSDTERVDVSNKIITPGFTNTHIHAWQTAFRSLGANVTLAQYFTWFSQEAPNATLPFNQKDDVYISSLQGYLAGLYAGVTGYVEHAHANFSSVATQESFEAAADSGARVWWCYDVHLYRSNFGIDEQLAILRELKKREHEGTAGLTRLGLAVDSLLIPGNPETGPEKVKDLAKELDVAALTAHCLGGPWPPTPTPTSVEECDLHSINRPLILSHAGFVTESDGKALRKNNHNVSITPESEMHYGHGQVNGRLILDHASLGVDTTFTFSSDILTQARIYLQHVRHHNYIETLDKGLIPNTVPMSVDDAFLLATRQGGRAVWRNDLGVLAVGAKADLVVFDGESPNMLGWTNAVAAVILHANVGDIEHVMVGGEWRKRDGRLITPAGKLTWQDVKQKFAGVARRVQAQNDTLPDMPEKLFGVGEFGDVEISAIKKCEGQY